MAFASVLLNLWKYYLNASEKNPRQLRLFRKNIYCSSSMIFLVASLYDQQKNRYNLLSCICPSFLKQILSKIMWTIYYHQLGEAFLDCLDWIISFWILNQNSIFFFCFWIGGMLQVMFTSLMFVLILKYFTTEKLTCCTLSCPYPY